MKNNFEFVAIKVDQLDDESNSEFDHSQHESESSSDSNFSDLGES